ncbi:hypothetical protein K2Z83_09590 [Oscillochloris sp. ZM17-4]|uniref:C25 family cysteine peptidase n=1 Tax=Oscillochloris sp. ZM17-4 TaxID=2866714 RepID=UPI001C73764F|nr:C25 family cysteine peptidase [Oscillochloris sp. ZM17-4]MBX0327926.1 hypothetical protein [Oscillochloris sp. ZM17-4]
MATDPYDTIYEALQRATELMGQHVEQLGCHQEEEERDRLRKIQALIERLAELFHRRDFPKFIAQTTSTGRQTSTPVNIHNEYDTLTQLLDQHLNPRQQAPAGASPQRNLVQSAGGEELYPNGIDAHTGQPLLHITAGDIVAMAQNRQFKPPDTAVESIYKAKVAAFCRSEEFAPSGEPMPEAVTIARGLIGGIHTYGTIADVDQDTIAEARWAVVVRAKEDVAVLKALAPLIQHRMRQMGCRPLNLDFQSGDSSCGAWLRRHTDDGKKSLRDNWGEVPPVLLVRTGETVNNWLTRHRVSQAPVDPKQGVPFYLMIVGRPGPLDPHDDVFIPWGFQYELDVFWGVGRLLFTDASGRHRLDAYRDYAEQVVAWETRADAASHLRKEIAFIGTRHEGDTSTERSAKNLVTPLAAWSGAPNTTPARLGFGHRLYLGDDATRDNLTRMLSASAPPAILFSATHGIGLRSSDDPARLVMHQGALLTADFAYGSIRREHWLAGEDLDAMSNLNVAGMIACLFACYSAGCPQHDEFAFEPGKPRAQIAPFSFVSQLPQRLLAHGALAVLGHIERAWTYSFSGVEGGADSQIQPFQDVIGRLLKGMPAGSATDQFNVIQGARSLTLTKELEDIRHGIQPNPARLARLWMARNDARNYVLLGDPAVRLAI